MKNKLLIIIPSIFFLIVNTTYYWEAKLGLLAFPVFLLLFVIYFGLSITLFIQIYFLIKEKFENKRRLFRIVLLLAILVLTYFKPFGLFDFSKLEGEDLLVAQREGAANCMTTFKLKDDLTFREKNVCFGVTEIIGTYRISNDTIYFESVKWGKQGDKKYEFAVIKELENYTENAFALNLYTNKKDTIGFSYFIQKNELKIKPKKVYDD